jgi:hypothetical protein
VLDAYLAKIEVELVRPIFRHRSGGKYTKDRLVKDFAAARAAVFGDGDRRQLADFRPSGTAEAFTGKATPADVSAKMGNTISQSNKLHQIYSPVQLEAVRDADASRRIGRRRIRQRTEVESFPAAGPKVSARTRKAVKCLK